MNYFKNVLAILLLSAVIGACTDAESEKYTGKQVQYQLFQASDFDYTGIATIREMIGGNLELTIQLEGERGSEEVSYPGHLHFGSYSTPNAPIAFMLNPIKASSLESITILEQLTDGNRLLFDEIEGFQGHIKVHLASDGPDYETILVAGNIGALGHSQAFDIEQMVICGKDF